MTSDAQGPYSPAETCTSCSHQSFWHGSGAPRCSFMVQGKILCGCTNLRFQGRAQQPDDALRVAARRLLASAIPMEGTDGEWDAAIAQMRAALDGAPFEPSEEMVGRVRDALMESDGAKDWQIPAYTRLARAALRAAFSPGGSPSGTGQQQTAR